LSSLTNQRAPNSRSRQILLNNLLYDISQTAVATDNVDHEFLKQPCKWEIGGISRFMLVMGPFSSAFDYVTFAVMLSPGSLVAEAGTVPNRLVLGIAAHADARGPRATHTRRGVHAEPS
jgi:hypothetical protein